MPTVDLTARLARETKPGDRDVFLFDRALPGFGLRVHRSGAKAWIVQTRIEGKSRRVVIARHGEMDLAQARRHARDILARIRAGDNPADDIRKEKTAPTVAMLADEYLRRCDPYWKPSGRKTIRTYLKARILPTFCKMPVERVGPEDVAAWFDAVSKDRPGAAIRLLALTGCRRGEVLNLRWRDIGDNAIALPDSKTGPRSVPLGGAARAVIKALPEPRDPDAYLFPSLAGGRHAHRVVACWQAVCGDANLGKIRLHDLRHTAASHAVMSGGNLPLVGKLLGHRRHETTAGYAHLADGDLVETAEKVGSLIADAMNLQVLSPPSRPRSRRRYGRWI